MQTSATTMRPQCKAFRQRKEVRQLAWRSGSPDGEGLFGEYQAFLATGVSRRCKTQALDE